MSKKKLITKDQTLSEANMALVDNGLTTQQALHMVQGTPKDHVYRRPAKGGGQWDYVTGVYVKKVLNYVFGWKWSFEVKDHGREGDHIWVLGKLKVILNDGTEVVKEQFGRAEAKRKKGGGDYLDYGNDLKSATTDALKKCASELGIASDIYGKNEWKEIRVEMVDELPQPEDKKEPTVKVDKSKVMENIKKEAK
jgi:recombination DNA repair RAD52 pathway protein